MVALAKRITDATRTPVVGGVAVILHGGGRQTSDIDIYTDDLWSTHQKLEDAGAMWNSAAREHVFENVPVHMVSTQELGGPPSKVSTIRGVRVISLADLVRVKLRLGLESVRRSKDLAHVIDLIARVPLRKDFASKLPRELRAPFKELVEQVHEPRRSPLPAASYLARHRGPRRAKAHRRTQP